MLKPFKNLIQHLCTSGVPSSSLWISWPDCWADVGTVCTSSTQLLFLLPSGPLGRISLACHRGFVLVYRHTRTKTKDKTMDYADTLRYEQREKNVSHAHKTEFWYFFNKGFLTFPTIPTGHRYCRIKFKSRLRMGNEENWLTVISNFQFF